VAHRVLYERARHIAQGLRHVSENNSFRAAIVAQSHRRCRMERLGKKTIRSNQYDVTIKCEFKEIEGGGCRGDRKASRYSRKIAGGQSGVILGKKKCTTKNKCANSGGKRRY